VALENCAGFRSHFALSLIARLQRSAVDIERPRSELALEMLAAHAQFSDYAPRATPNRQTASLIAASHRSDHADGLRFFGFGLDQQVQEMVVGYVR